MSTWSEFLQGEASDPRKLEMPRIWNIGQGNLQAVNRSHPQERFMNSASKTSGAGPPTGAGPSMLQLHHASSAHQISDLKLKISCLPAWIFVLLWSHLVFLCPNSFLLEWECSFCAIVQMHKHMNTHKKNSVASIITLSLLSKFGQT